MSFTSFLDKVGADFLKVLPWAQKGAAIIGIFDPSLGALFNSTVNIVTAVEQKYAALGKQSGTGTQKLADALLIGEPVIAQGLKLAGMPAATADVSGYISSVVTVLNTIPAPTPAPTAA